MACRGVLFALEESDIDTLLAFEDVNDRIEHVSNVIEERELGGDSLWAAETDKAELQPVDECVPESQALGCSRNGVGVHARTFMAA